MVCDFVFVARQALPVTPSVVEGSGREGQVRLLRRQMSRLRFAPLDMTEGQSRHDNQAHTHGSPWATYRIAELEGLVPGIAEGCPGGYHIFMAAVSWAAPPGLAA